MVVNIGLLPLGNLCMTPKESFMNEVMQIWNFSDFPSTSVTQRGCFIKYITILGIPLTEVKSDMVATRFTFS